MYLAIAIILAITVLTYLDYQELYYQKFYGKKPLYIVFSLILIGLFFELASRI